MNPLTNSNEPETEFGKLLKYLDNYYVSVAEFGCFVALSEDKSTLFFCPMNGDGSPEKYEDHPGHMNWIEVTAPEPKFLDIVNELFGTAFEYEQFPGR